MSSPPKRKKSRISIVKGPPLPMSLLRLPPETILVPPAALQQEEVIIHDDDYEKTGAGPKRKVAKLLMKRWVFTSATQSLQGFTMPLDETYMALVMAPGGGSLQLVPLESIVSLRPGIPGRAADDDALIQEFLRTGSKFRAQANAWNSRYGAELVGMVECGQDEYGGEGAKPGAGRRREQVWTRQFNPDDDDNDYILPTSRVALNYNDLLNLGHDDDEDGGGDVIEAVHQATDLGQDEIPDGAEEGFGGLEFGEETRKEHGGAMVTQEEQGPRGLYGSDEEDDDNSEGGWKWSDEDEEGRQREQQLHKPTLSKSTVPVAAAVPGPSKAGHQHDTDSDFSEVDDDDDDDDDDGL